MIREISPSRAKHLSDNGHSFDVEPPLARRLSFRIKNRSLPGLPYWLTRDYTGRVIDPEMLVMRRFFGMDRVKNADHLNGIYSLE
ncbi:MAG: hypothetical protein VW547_16825 [Alphaproteobacteria bacterium]